MFPVYEQKKENVHILQKTSRHAPPHLHNSVEFIYVISGSMEIGMGQELLPDSIVTVYVGRHAIELGFKYLMTKKNIKIEKDHDLKELYKKLDAVEKIDEDYMEYVDTFCEKYCKYIEGGNPEYFRYPEYKSSQYFAGNCLDAKWLSYNFALILLKLLHLADLEKEI